MSEHESLQEKWVGWTFSKSACFFFIFYFLEKKKERFNSNKEITVTVAINCSRVKGSKGNVLRYELFPPLLLSPLPNSPLAPSFWIWFYFIFFFWRNLTRKIKLPFKINRLRRRSGQIFLKFHKQNKNWEDSRYYKRVMSNLNHKNLLLEEKFYNNNNNIIWPKLLF